MACDICRRGHDAKRLPFLCAVDARNQAYEGRIKHLQLLLENEGLRSQIHELLAADPVPSSSEALEVLRSQQMMTEDRTAQIVQAADKLRNEIKAARDEIQSRKEALSRRKSDLAAVSDGLKERRARQQHEVERSTQMLKFRWSQSANDMVDTRIFLCDEAASVYGLKRLVKRGNKNPEYQIGGVPVVDLVSMNSLSPELITTSLGHISHILMLASRYLAVRLPAEVTTPHADYPYPTIFHLSCSYRHDKLAFPGTSGATTPIQSASEPTTRHIPRPRPLYIHKPLPQLLKDDPAAYSSFLEGVALLAYDIAWLCSSQGIPVIDKNAFDDICQMGRNLHQLLVKPHGTGTADDNKNVKPDDGTSDRPLFGRYSHATMYYFLSGAKGTDFAKTFQLPNPMKLADKLKKKLAGDAPAPDWEVLDDDAWMDMPAEELVHVHNAAQSDKRKATALREKSKASSGSKGSSGSNGWTKVR